MTTKQMGQMVAEYLPEKGERTGLILSPDIEYDNINRRVRINLDGHQYGDPNLNIRDYQNEREELETIIRNTYRVLASRGAKGCFIYCCDEGLQNYLGNLIPPMNVDVPDDYVTYQDENELDDQMYIGNSGYGIFHYPNCQFVPRNLQKRVEFATRQEAVDAGYNSCPACHP